MQNKNVKRCFFFKKKWCNFHAVYCKIIYLEMILMISPALGERLNKTSCGIFPAEMIYIFFPIHRMATKLLRLAKERKLFQDMSGQLNKWWFLSCWRHSHYSTKTSIAVLQITNFIFFRWFFKRKGPIRKILKSEWSRCMENTFPRSKMAGNYRLPAVICNTALYQTTRKLEND